MSWREQITYDKCQLNMTNTIKHMSTKSRNGFLTEEKNPVGCCRQGLRSAIFRHWSLIDWSFAAICHSPFHYCSLIVLIVAGICCYLFRQWLLFAANNELLLSVANVVYDVYDKPHQNGTRGWQCMIPMLDHRNSPWNLTGQNAFHYECIFSLPTNFMPVPSFILSTRCT